ncbi:MAG: DUF5686 family protein [Rhodothermales bacterium]
MFLAFCFFISGFSSTQIVEAQHLVNGIVSDAETGESLPSANVQIDGTYQGTITNVDGQFSLQLPSLPAVLVFRYIGYESQYIDVTGDANENINVALQPTVYSLGEVVITEKDPAVDIMRKVIERKKIWREELASYSAEAYNRFTLKNDTGIVSIIESFTDTYWDPVEGTREVIKARRQTSNLDISDVLPAAQFVANLYDDNIDIAGYNFLGVTHPKALDHYIFELLGYRRLDDQVVFDISVRPKNKLKTGFVGKIAVLDDEYALLEVELHPGEAFLFPPPIEAFDVTYEQQFSNFGAAAWLPVDFRSSMSVDIGFNRLLSFPTFFIEQVSRISNYDVNITVPDTLFAKGKAVVVDSVSVAEDTLLDVEGIAVPLDKAEASAYETIDSTMTLAKAYEPSGPLAKVMKVSARNSNTDDEVTLSGEEGAEGKKRLNLNLRPHVRFNRVEEFYGELGISRSLAEWVRFYGSIGFSTALKGEEAISYVVGSRFRLDKKNRLSLDLNYARYTDTQTGSTPVLRTFNGIVTLFEGIDYFDYYRNLRFRSTLSFDVPNSQIGLKAGLQIESHGDLAKATDYDILGGDFIQRSNPETRASGVHSFVAEISLGDKEETMGLLERKFLSVGIEHGLPGLDSDHAFTIYNLEFEWRFNTFFQRRLLPNALDVKVVAQKGFGDVTVTRFGAVDGRMSFYNRFGTLKTLQSKPYRGEDVVGLFWEHNFKTVPFEILGMRRFAENGLNLIVFGGHARTWLSASVGADRSAFVCLTLGSECDVEFVGLVNSAPNWHQEVGVSLSGLFSLFRVDFATRLDAPGFTVGIGSARIF